MSQPDQHSAVKREAALLSWIQHSAPYGIITLDTSFRVQSWNGWMEIHSNMTMKSVEGKVIFDLFPELHERKLVSRFVRTLNGEFAVLSTALHHHLLPLPSSTREGDDAFMKQTARISPLLHDGAVFGIVIVIEDVSHRENQASALSRQHRRDEAISWALSHLLASEEPRKTIRQLFFKIVEHLDFDTFFLYLRDPETGVIGLQASGGVEIHPAHASSENEMMEIVPPDSKETILIDSVQSLPEPKYALLRNAGVRAVVGIPLWANDRKLGILFFGASNREVIAPHELELLSTIGQYLAIAVDRDYTQLQLINAKEQLSAHSLLLEQKVEERTSRLKETVAELETFSYTLAHDLKAPIRGMTGYCDILLEDFASSMSKEASSIVEKLARASKRMDALTRDLLEFSRISRQEIVLSRVELDPVIESILSIRSPEVQKAVSCQAPLHPVRGHRALIEQVLANLIDNAYKFVDAGKSPQIHIFTEIVAQSSPNTRSRPLLFSAAEPADPLAGLPKNQTQAGHVRLSVQDNGIGIQREAHQKIFGVFERGIATDSYEGTGMGLAIVARAIQRMGGTCGVESEPGMGSRFWIELPTP